MYEVARLPDRDFNPQNQLTNMGRSPKPLTRVARSGKVPVLRIRGAAWAKYPSLRERDRPQGYPLHTTPSGAERAQSDFVPEISSAAVCAV